MNHRGGIWWHVRGDNEAPINIIVNVSESIINKHGRGQAPRPPQEKNININQFRDLCGVWAWIL